MANVEQLVPASPNRRVAPDTNATDGVGSYCALAEACGDGRKADSPVAPDMLTTNSYACSLPTYGWRA
jgi:hypothetical protein